MPGKTKEYKRTGKQVTLKEATVKEYEEKACSILEACRRPISGIALESEIAKLREDVSFAFNQAERVRKLEVESEGLNRKKKKSWKPGYLRRKRHVIPWQKSGLVGLGLTGLTLRFQ